MESLIEIPNSLQPQCELTSPNTSTDITETPENSFRCFFFQYFSVGVKRVETTFKPGKHLIDWCTILQVYPHTLLESARLFLKSTVHLAYVAWKLYTLNRPYYEMEYMGYVEDLSINALKRLKRYIYAIPEVFGGYKELTDAESILRYSNKENQEFICTPSGILTFKRGRHPHAMILDDILKDPEKKLDISQLEKIERIFFEEVELMPTEELHVTGTPQDRLDLFNKLKTKSKYFYRSYQAEKNGVALWEENFPMSRLAEIKDTIGEKAYKKEMMCSPVRSEEGFVSLEKYESLVNSKLKNHPIVSITKLNNGAFAGLDIGKKSHPSHFFVLAPNRHKKLIQIHSKWMDGWDYTRQIEYCKQAIKAFGIITLLYDDTRAEFEGFKEQGKLPSQMQGVVFSTEEKFEMASALDVVITNDGIQFIDDKRQRNQMISVDNDLKAMETAEGHGDCFFSLCLAIKAYKKGMRRMIIEIGG